MNSLLFKRILNRPIKYRSYSIRNYVTSSDNNNTNGNRNGNNDTRWHLLYPAIFLTVFYSIVLLDER